MAGQLELFTGGEKSKTIIYVKISELALSRFNPRIQRDNADIEKLAERIKRNGFEVTRALWAYEAEGVYQVFAGGTRLQAAQLAQVETVPVVLHVGYDETDIVRLAYEDNENDEYHAPVNIVDEWANYAALAAQGWTQVRIAEAVGVGQKTVSFRLKLNELPDTIKRFIHQGSLNETHLMEINTLFIDEYFSPWLTTEAAQLEVCQVAADKKMTVRDTKKLVDQWKAMITLAEKVWADLEAHYWRKEFVRNLEANKAKTSKVVQRCADKVYLLIEEDAKKEAEEAENKLTEAEEKAAEAKHRELIESVAPGQWWKLGRHLMYCGDTSQPEFYEGLPSCSFAFADPPYNADVAEWDNNFSWHHDWLIDKADVVCVTPGIVSIFEFAKVTNMPYLWSVACWISNGMTRGALGFGNWVYGAMFSGGSLFKQSQDFFKVSISPNDDRIDHKGRKPPEFIKWLIELYGDSGVIDPFLGSGTTIFECEKLGVVCYGGEVNPEYCKAIITGWENLSNQTAERIAQND